MLDRTSPTSILDDLKRQRADLAATFAALSAARDRLRQAESDETAALAAIGDLGRREVAAMSDWASGGMVGPQPTCDAAERAKLTRELVAAQADAEAARGAGKDLDTRLAAETARGADLRRLIDAAALAVLIERFREERVAVDDMVADVRARIAAAYAITAWMRDFGADLRRSGHDDDATTLFRHLEPLLAVPLPDVSPSNGDVAAAAPLWAARFEELRR